MPGTVPTALSAFCQLISTTTVWEMFCSHLAGEGTKVRKVSTLSKITEIAMNRAKIQSQDLLDSGVWSQSLSGSPEWREECEPAVLLVDLRGPASEHADVSRRICV